MPSLDIVAIIKDFGVAVGFAVYCIYQMRQDRADALRREAAYSAALEVINKQLMAMVQESSDASRALRDQLHELKNVILRVALAGAKGGSE